MIWVYFKARVDKVHIDGLERTKDDYVQDCFTDLFSATTFQDVLIAAHRSRLKLEELGCFKNIAVFVDTSKGVGSTPEGLDVGTIFQLTHSSITYKLTLFR